jgi:hypothetical protein
MELEKYRGYTSVTKYREDDTTRTMLLSVEDL